MDKNHTYQDLLELAAASPVTELPAAPEAPEAAAGADEGHEAGPSIEPDRRVTEALGIDVLGERPNGEIVVFAQGKTDVIPKISRLSIPDLYQIAGPAIRGRVFLGEEAAAPDSFHLRRVTEAIAMQAGQQRIFDQTARGSGCWLSRDRLVLVGSREAAVWDLKAEKLSRVTRPKVAGMLLDLDSRPWYTFERLSADLERAADAGWRQTALDELVELLALWRWQIREGASMLLAGLVLASWVQTVWRWRPHVALTAESTSGKTSFLDLLKGIYGPLELATDRPSEAGLRQKIRHRACVVLIDEFESDHHRRRVLELLRTSGTGSRILRGTPGQGGIEFGLRHICWIAAIEVGMERQPDRNRYLSFEMLRPTAEAQQAFRMPPTDALVDLGQRLLAIAVRATGPALALASELGSHPLEGFDGRTVESLAVPAAMLAVALGHADSPAAAREVLEFCARSQVSDQSHQESDQVELMQTILASLVSLEKGQQASVSQLLSHASLYSDAPEALECVGLAVASDSVGPRQWVNAPETGLFLDVRTIRRYLLSGTRWAEGSQSIDTILLRLPTARRRKRRLTGRLVWGVELDWAWFDEHFLGDDEGDQTESAASRF